MPDLSQPLLDLDNAPVIERVGENGPLHLTAARACVGALMGTLPGDDRALSAEDKLRCFTLAQRITGSPVLDLTVEDTAFLKRRVGAAWSPLVVGRVYEILDPACLK